MPLKNLHIRVSNEEYDFLCALAEELHCSQAEVIRKALFHSEMKAIVQAYRKRQGDAYLQRIVACGLDDGTAEKLNRLQKDMNENTLQIRRIGTNLSTLIRDIRAGKVQLQNDEEKETFLRFAEALTDTYNRTMSKQETMAEKAADLMDRTTFKVRIRGNRDP